MLIIDRELSLPESEIRLQAVRATGPGGQNVNKVASAIHLQFDIGASSLPAECKSRLLQLGDRRISSNGIVVIKAQRYRDQARNRQDALDRLAALIRRAMARPAPRIPTRPGAAAKRRRLEEKSQRGQVKALRGRVSEQD